MAVINTNTKALFTQAALISTERTLSKTMEQLSTESVLTLQAMTPVWPYQLE